MHFSFPPDQWLLWLIAGGLTVALLWAALSALERHRDRRLHGFAEAGLLSRLILGYAPALRRPLNVLVIVGTVSLLVAVSGPRWGEKEGAEQRGNREILVLLDTSESMNAINPPPSRLDRARQKITTLLLRYPADRFGLVAFSGGAALQCPLTQDHAYFKTVLQSVTTDTLTAEGTDIESAFVEAEKLFEGEQGHGAGGMAADRIILLISDGEAVHGDAIAAAGRLGRYGRVVVMGIGDPEGAEVTLPQWMLRSRYTPQNTAPHWSVLDEKHLSEIALAGRGVYVRSTLGDADLGVIGREMERLEGIGRAEALRQREVNRYRWPLALAVACFAGEGLWLVLLPALARRRYRRPPVEGGAGAVA